MDNLEQYSRRTSIRITGLEENKNGEHLEKITTNLIVDMNLQDHITLDNINRLHRILPLVDKQEPCATNHHPV